MAVEVEHPADAVAEVRRRRDALQRARLLARDQRVREAEPGERRAGSVGRPAGEPDLHPGAVEAFLFGNAGRTGTVKALDLAGSSFQSAVYSTGAISYGRRLPAVPLSNFAVGATAKYTVGHMLVSGVDNGSSIGTSCMNRLTIAS